MRKVKITNEWKLNSGFKMFIYVLGWISFILLCMGFFMGFSDGLFEELFVSSGNNEITGQAIATENEIIEEEYVSIINEMEDVSEEIGYLITKINVALELGNLNKAKGDIADYVALVQKFDKKAMAFKELADRNNFLDTNEQALLDLYEQEILEWAKENEIIMTENINIWIEYIQSVEENEAISNLLSSLVLGLI